jgi:hypothetical protein
MDRASKPARNQNRLCPSLPEIKTGFVQRRRGFIYIKKRRRRKTTQILKIKGLESLTKK